MFSDDSGGSGPYDGAPEAGGAGGVQSNAGVLTVRASTFHNDAGGDGAAGPDDGQQQGGNGGAGAISGPVVLTGGVVVQRSLALQLPRSGTVTATCNASRRRRTAAAHRSRLPTTADGAWHASSVASRRAACGWRSAATDAWRRAATR